MMPTKPHKDTSAAATRPETWPVARTCHGAVAAPCASGKDDARAAGEREGKADAERRSAQKKARSGED